MGLPPWYGVATNGLLLRYIAGGCERYTNFGYPQAHEDDAERAVRAGLELIAAVSALKSPISQQTLYP